MKASLSLTEAIDFYLSARRSLGFTLTPNEDLLRSLARYAEKVGHRGPLTEKFALDWVRLPQSAKLAWWARRLAVVHRFARFWHEFDAKVQVPPLGLFGPEGRRGPVHIYTKDETGSLLEAALALRRNVQRPTSFWRCSG